MFFNEIHTLSNASESKYSNHLMLDYSRGPDHTILVLLFVFIFVFQKHWFKVIQKLSQKVKLIDKVENLGNFHQDHDDEEKHHHHKASMSHFNDDWEFHGHVDENIGSYWECLSGIDQKRWVARELHIQKKLNLKSLDNTNFGNLCNSTRQKKCISSICNYRMLENHEYANSMYFFHIQDRNTDWKSEVSDVVYLLLEIGEDRC